mmetsp:Transcript_22290/g.48490  ORF Transcript_22290/g.48490 Transcript_22290/m.48490 type:complete len:111 (+) Transcript_22290:512-844(+)
MQHIEPTSKKIQMNKLRTLARYYFHWEAHWDLDGRCPPRISFNKLGFREIAGTQGTIVDAKILIASSSNAFGNIVWEGEIKVSEKKCKDSPCFQVSKIHSYAAPWGECKR